ncbi:MAG TPA: VOC family protein [Capillimicrobium sp.]|jgi:catechol 2,3-dioxygenase-like lactoylglutathione lyase family enzyme
MINRLGIVNVWVTDQDEAIAFWTEKVGFELRDDVTLAELGDFRWVTVNPPQQPDLQLALMTIPGPPVFEPETKRQVEETLAKGATGGLFFMTDDCQGTYEELKAKGVEFTQEPEERPYGIDCGFRDPFGNSFRLSQLTSS